MLGTFILRCSGRNGKRTAVERLEAEYKPSAVRDINGPFVRVEFEAPRQPRGFTRGRGPFLFGKSETGSLVDRLVTRKHCCLSIAGCGLSAGLDALAHCSTAQTFFSIRVALTALYQLSYRDLEEMIRERGLNIDHTTVFRWVQLYAPEINRRIRPHLKLTGASYRIDETHIKVGKQCKYLYRAVDKEGQTIEFMLSAKRDVSAAKRFFKKKMMLAEYTRLPFSINVDSNAAYPVPSSYRKAKGSCRMIVNCDEKWSHKY